MTNDELARELKDYLASMQQEMRDQRDFTAIVARLRENTTLELRKSGQEASTMIQWFIRQGENALTAFLETLTATTQRASGEAVSLAEVSRRALTRCSLARTLSHPQDRAREQRRSDQTERGHRQDGHHGSQWHREHLAGAGAPVEHHGGAGGAAAAAVGVHD